MKRCPQCNRIEADEALKFCRVDGATLVNDSGSVGSEVGTAQLGSPSDASEVHTSILPQNTSGNINRATGPTTTLPAESTSVTGELKTSKRRSRVAVIIGAALLVAIIVGSTYLYLTRNKTRAIESIAVMPFSYETGNAEVEYLSDGMTETLIKSLSQIPSLNVKPRSSVFRYKGKNTDSQTIAKELNVQAILNGTVSQRGDQLTLSLELVDVQKDSVIWTERYQRNQSELLSLQNEIAKDVSSNLRKRLTGVEETKVGQSGTADPQAYQAYLRGRYYWNRRTAANLQKALEQFKLATDRDPNYALAFLGLADCYTVLSEYGGIPSNETIPQARSYAQRALAIDPTLAEVHTTMGALYDNEWKWAESEKEFKRAIELNPNYPTTYHWYSILLRNLGRYEESLAAIKRGSELDSLSSVIAVNVSRVYQDLNDHDAAISNSQKIIDLDPNFPPAHEYLALSLLEKGRIDEAVTSSRKAVELSNRSGVCLGDLGYVYARAGKRTEALTLISELEAKYARREAVGHDLAAVYVGLNEFDKVFEWLEKDFAAHNGRLPGIRWEPQFKTLREDPRYKDLMKRMNLNL